MVCVCVCVSGCVWRPISGACLEHTQPTFRGSKNVMIGVIHILRRSLYIMGDTFD